MSIFSEKAEKDKFDFLVEQLNETGIVDIKFFDYTDHSNYAYGEPFRSLVKRSKENRRKLDLIINHLGLEYKSAQEQCRECEDKLIEVDETN